MKKLVITEVKCLLCKKTLGQLRANVRFAAITCAYCGATMEKQQDGTWIISTPQSPKEEIELIRDTDRPARGPWGDILPEQFQETQPEGTPLTTVVPLGSDFGDVGERLKERHNATSKLGKEK